MLYQVLDNLPIGWFVRLAILRLAAQWRSILTIIVGVFLTAMIGASIPLYTNAIAQIGMIQRLDQRELEETHLFTRTSSSDLNDEAFLTRWADYDAAVEEIVPSAFEAFPGWLEHTIDWGESVTMQLVQDDQPLEDTFLGVAHYSELGEFVEILDGELPTTTNGDVFPVAVSDEVAAHLDLAVGDQITLDQGGWETSIPIPLVITAIVRERDTDAPYWMSPSPFRVERNPRWQAYAFTTRENLERIAVEFVPQTRIQLGWRFLFDHNELPFTRIDEAITLLNNLEGEIGARLEAIAGERVTFIFNTELPEIYADYRGEVDVLGVPFSLLLIQLVALVMFFLIVIGSLVRRSERREIGMLKSRGVLNRQIILLRGAEALIICIVAVIAAPTLARMFLLLLMPVFTDTGTIPLEIQSSAYVYAGVASFAALVVLIVTLIPVLRTPLILTSGQTDREQGQVWWQRYYLDVVLLVIGLVALVQMVNAENSIAAEDQTTDPLMLLVPTLLIIALGSVSLRVFPSMMRTASRFFYRRQAVEPILASWQVSREPVHYGRIAFLLALAISVGWFALSFQSTVINSQADQAIYQTGADVRVTYTPAQEDLLDWLQNREDVADISVAYRFEDVTVPTRGFGLTQTNLLVVENDTFSDAAYFRDDLGSVIVPEFEQPIPQTGIPLGDIPDTAQLELVYLDAPPIFAGTTVSEVSLSPQYLGFLFDTLFITLRFRDEAGNVLRAALLPTNLEEITEYILSEYNLEDDVNIAQIVTPPLEELPNQGWVRHEADISFLQDIPGTIYFEGVVVQQFNNFGSSGVNVLTIRDLTIGDTTIALDDSEFINEQASFPLLNNLPEEVNIVPGVDEARIIAWARNDSNTIFAHYVNVPEVISTDNTRANNNTVPADEIVGIPAIISPSFAQENELVEGQKFQVFLDQSIVWLEVTDIRTYYPTLYNDDVPFIVVEEDALLYTLLRRPTATFSYEREVWIQLTDRDQTADFVAELEMLDTINIMEIVRLDDAIENIQADLLSVGLIGLLFFSAAIGFLLSVVSLLTYAALNVQDRRTELAVLKALGLNMPRLIGSLAIEQILVIIISLLLGLGIGILLSIQVIPVLSINTAGSGITPPFLIQTEPLQLLLYSGGIILIMIFELAVSSVLIRRLATMQALRTGE